MTKALPDDASLPVLWIVTRELGVGSQVWMMRQIAALREFRPVVVTWIDHRPAEAQAASRLTVHVLPFPVDLSVGPKRWWNRLKRAPIRNFYATRGAEQRHLTALARQDRPVVILAHFGHTGLRMLPVAELLGLPLVCHFHGLDLSSSLGNRWYRWSLLRHMSRFDGLVTVGTRQRDWVALNAPATVPQHLIPCGVPVAEFSRSPAEAVRPEPDPPIFLIVSRLVRQKGVDYCLKALSHLPRGNLQLRIVGDGPERQALGQLSCDLGIESEVTFLGSLDWMEVRAELSKASAFIQHSLDMPDGAFEGFGVTVAEASAMEVPTIASRCGGLIDQIIDGETGLLVDQRDDLGLAFAMQRLAGDPAVRCKLGQAARRRTLVEFNTPQQVEKLESALRQAIARRRAA